MEMKSSKQCYTPTWCHSTLKLQTRMHSCLWVLSKELKGSSDLLPFTGHASQPWTSFKFGSEPRPSLSWTWDSTLYLPVFEASVDSTRRDTSSPNAPCTSSTQRWQRCCEWALLTEDCLQRDRKAAWGRQSEGMRLPCSRMSFPTGRSKLTSHFIGSDVFSTATALVGTSTCNLNIQLRQTKSFWNELTVFWYQLLKSSCQRQNLRLS